MIKFICIIFLLCILCILYSFFQCKNIEKYKNNILTVDLFIPVYFEGNR